MRKMVWSVPFVVVGLIGFAGCDDKAKYDGAKPEGSGASANKATGASPTAAQPSGQPRPNSTTAGGGGVAANGGPVPTHAPTHAPTHLGPSETPPGPPVQAANMAD